MACSVCSANVEKKLQSLEGINSASVSLTSRTALVDYDPDIISLEDMKREISNAGYDLVIENDRSVEEINRREFTLLRRRTLASWLFAILTMCFSMGWISLGMEQNMISDGVASAHHSSSFANQICLLLALANLLYCGKQFYVSAWKQLLHHTANMDSLVALSTLIAFLFSTFNTFFGEMVWGARGIEWHTYFDASVMIITFVLTGRCLEEKAKDSTASSIRQLMGMQPKTARLVTYEKIEGTNDYKMEEVPISTIQIGDMIEVRAGEKIPVDGVVTQAESFMTPDAAYVDEAMISGEPTPAMKKAGDNVLAGTIPSQGKLRMRAKQIGENTALAHIIRMVQEAQGSKAPVQRIVDKAALIFVPAVAAIALITFIIWWLIGGNAALPQAILSAVAVLVIACPCAMGLATPTALMVGIGKAAQKQILIKDASALENLHKINALVIDKTGTLTIPNQNIDFTKQEDLDLAVAGKGNRGLYDEWRQGGSGSLLGGESRHQALPEQGAAWRQAGIGKETSGRRQAGSDGGRRNQRHPGPGPCQREHGDRKGNGCGDGCGADYADERRPLGASGSRKTESEDGSHDLAESLLGVHLQHHLHPAGSRRPSYLWH